MSPNLSTVSDDLTARTDPECAAQRAANLAVLGVRSVLELCVGPSLRTMEEAYAGHGISVTGNDLDPRWQRYHPDGRWIIGDALTISWDGFDAVVFAPPLSHNCTGRRDDALMINDVSPGYRAFMARPFDGLRAMVLPARSLATSYDRADLHHLICVVRADVIPLTAGVRKIRKYVDVYYRSA